MKPTDVVKVGAVVRLLSGSEELTIDKILKDGRVVCVWFDQRGAIHSKTFAAEALWFRPQN